MLAADVSVLSNMVATAVNWLASVYPLLREDKLIIAVLQIVFGGIVAYFLTERWQRWRQRREFQYRTMSKFSETSMELFVVLGELLSIHPLRQAMADVWDERQRRYISQRVPFHALEADIMASFKSGRILSSYYELNKKAKALFEFVQSTGYLNETAYKAIQDEFLKRRKNLLGQMIAEMKLLPWWERGALRQKKAPS